MKNPDAWQAIMYDEVLARATLASREYARIARFESEFLRVAMGLAAGERLLDIPCGTGRHARVFARHGIRVTGVDLNPKLIRLAKAGRVKGARFVVGDMRALGKCRGKFDAVVNLFTSFGYFADERKNREVLHGMVAALRPGGRLAIHLVDRDWLLKKFRAKAVRTAGGVRTSETRAYDRRTKRIIADARAVDLRTGKVRKYRHSTRLYSKPEMVRLLKDAGLARTEVYGDTDGSLFQKGRSAHPIYVGWKR
jgi:SAM-dependent methyltransferase